MITSLLKTLTLLSAQYTLRASELPAVFFS